MLSIKKSIKTITTKRPAVIARKFATEQVAQPVAGREFTYFDNLEIKDGIALIRFNGPNKMNTLSAGMQSDVENMFNKYIIGNKDVKGIVFLSSKSDNFIAGADIDMINDVKDKSELKAITMKGHKFFEEIKKLKIPLVAGIHGAAQSGPGPAHTRRPRSGRRAVP